MKFVYLLLSLLVVRLIYVETQLVKQVKTNKELLDRTNTAEFNFNICKFLYLQR